MSFTSKGLALLIPVSVLLSSCGDIDPPEEQTVVAQAESVKPWVSAEEDLRVSTTTTAPPPPPTTTTTAPPLPPTTTTTVASEPEAPIVQEARSGVNWYAIAMCESSLGTGSPQWHINTGNGYYGGLQFSYSTWQNYGGGRYAERADLATPDQQVAIASTMGLSHWPTCGKHG